MSNRKSSGCTIAIIGSGIIGLAVAAEVSKKHGGVYILERNDSFGKETSSRNSETIHAGIYYPGGSIKAETCVAGNALIYSICQQNRIGHRKTGKLIVATSEDEIGRLEELFERGRNNGVRGLNMLTGKEIKELEPNIGATAAMLSPSTGIVDSHTLMRYFLYMAQENGAEIAYRSNVTVIEKQPDGFELTVQFESGTFSFHTKVVINCAGLHSDRVAGLAGIDIDEAVYRIHYCKGEYFSVGNNKNRMISKLVYPVPDPGTGGTGIHNTFDIEGRMRLGPSARYVNEIDYTVDESQKDYFVESVKTFLPFIEYDDIEPEMAGIRPKLQGPGESYRDFVLKHEYDRGLPGLINLIGIESPGLTSSPSIAERVERLVNEIL